MTLQYSVGVQNARLDQIETTVGTSAVVKIWTGSLPVDCAAADSGTLLAEITCPSDWMAAASGGTKAKSGTWEDTSANATGTAGHFRLYDSGGTTCHIQGSVSATNGGGDIELNSLSITSGGTVTVTAFVLVDGNGQPVLSVAGRKGAVTLSGSDISSLPEAIGVACSDETTALTAGTAKTTFRMPYAMTLTEVRISLTTAQTSGSIFTVDINEGGTTILSTKATIDNTEKTSETAATAPVISDTALADDAEITVDIDQIGDGTAKGLKVWLIGTRT